VVKIPHPESCEFASRNLDSGLLFGNMRPPTRPDRVKDKTFASRLIEPLWAEFSFAGRAEVCDRGYPWLWYVSLASPWRSKRGGPPAGSWLLPKRYIRRPSRGKKFRLHQSL